MRNILLDINNQPSQTKYLDIYGLNITIKLNHLQGVGWLFSCFDDSTPLTINRPLVSGLQDIHQNAVPFYTYIQSTDKHQEPDQIDSFSSGAFSLFIIY